MSNRSIENCQHPAWYVYGYRKVKVTKSRKPTIKEIVINCCLYCGAEWERI